MLRLVPARTSGMIQTYRAHPSSRFSAFRRSAAALTVEK
jgi:hypothetical protein